jgi:hypothetical protein
MQLDLRHVGNDARPRGLGGADNRDAIRAIIAATLPRINVAGCVSE